MNKMIKIAMIGLLAALLVGMAAAQTYELKRLTLTNVDDAAGRWQFEGGTMNLNGKMVANYAVARRVVNGGTIAQNTAMLTMTIFFVGGLPPENMTLQGSHDYNSGNEIGSVSASSGTHHMKNGHLFKKDGATNKLTIF